MEKLIIEPKHVLNKVRLALSMDLKLAQMKGEDGTTIFEAEQFAPEYSVGIVQAEGIVPVPVGEYTLEDGSIMVVEVKGIIARIDAPTAMDDSPEATPAAEAPAAQAKKIVESVMKETFFSKEDAEKFLSEHEMALSEIETLKAEKAELEIKLSEATKVKPIKHNPESGKERAINLSKNESIVDFVNRVTQN